ncbi:MAG: hypothetical protein MJ160_07845 [Treponema sp.]|nr:hypothetical protein [Treponema sp.]
MKKISLLIQSLCPVFILTIIKIFPVNLFSLLSGSKGSCIECIKIYFKHLVSFDKVYIVLTVCLVLILWALITYLFFRDFNSVGNTSGFTINSVSTQEDASINFFFFFLLPLVVDDFSTWNSFCFYFAIIIFTGCLLWKTTLFYKNPVLTLLNYRIYSFKFDDNQLESKETLIGIGHEIIDDNTRIKYKALLPNVYFIKKIGV